MRSLAGDIERGSDWNAAQGGVRIDRPALGVSDRGLEVGLKLLGGDSYRLKKAGERLLGRIGGSGLRGGGGAASGAVSCGRRGARVGPDTHVLQQFGDRVFDDLVGIRSAVGLGGLQRGGDGLLDLG